MMIKTITMIAGVGKSKVDKNASPPPDIRKNKAINAISPNNGAPVTLTAKIPAIPANTAATTPEIAILFSYFL